MEEVAGIFARKMAYLERFVQIGLAGGRVIALSFPETPDDEATAEMELLDRIEAYLEGEADGFEDVTVALTGPTEHRSVLETTREVPYGEQVTVEQLARMTPGLDADDPDNQSLIRTALADNPVPLIIPDHRVRDGPSGTPPEVEQRLRSLEGL